MRHLKTWATDLKIGAFYETLVRIKVRMEAYNVPLKMSFT
jgi:hypothetical protein